jgi:alkanesulfonate monooxygenase SsuD/methylene tetrahydromethanopterin reductase-like flavin-dependent oxidoreductase (luciferase family)
MKFGLTVPYGDVRPFHRFAAEAEAAGWDGIFAGGAIWYVDPIVLLTSAAMVTRRIRLGTLILPAPLLKPWKIAGEYAALDNLSEGRVTLGLGAGAVWMGWQCFPDESTDKIARAEMLDETIDILTGLFAGKQFDYDGKHFHLKLTRMEGEHFPPRPVQKPRIPLWCVGVWPRKKSMLRALRCDGLIPQHINAQGQFDEMRPADLREMKEFIAANRPSADPFDIIVEGKAAEMSQGEVQEKVGSWTEAGATWWMEGLWGLTPEQALERIRSGPPPK